MSKPVEIEFLMKDNLSGGLDKAGQSVDNLIDRAKAASEAINVKIAEQHKVIDGVAADLDRMERQLAGMKLGTAQRDLAADVVACRKVLDEERGTLAALEQQHRQAEKAVSDLAKEHDKLAGSEEKAAISQLSLAERIAESKSLIKGTQAAIKELEKSYKNAAPGNAQSAALAELNAAKKALEEEKLILASLTAEQDRNKESNKRLSMQLRELQDSMAKMRLEGRQDSEEYRKMAAEAANLSDTIADLRTQTNILSNDDANLQGFMSGVSGLSGMFTAATGALSLFASENENLAKVQARVQSVMAVTMGLQQVFNTLNKDSAFRLVTVVKMKNLLTAANTRLATSLGISTVAAQALMATLTLGLSAVITGLIVLWNKYSDAQEEAARKAQEMVEIESEGRAQMIKTRFEIDSTIRSLKEFSGSKEEEKRKTDELNRKYGEAFGYYDTVAEWYDILTQKSADYIQMLFLQAKAQAMVNKAVEADDKLNKIKATSQDDVEGSIGWFRKSMLYFAQASEPGVQFDAQAAIDAHNKAAKEKAIRDAEAEREDYLRQAEELTRQAAQVGKDSHIGGHTKPDGPKPTNGKGYDPQKEHEREMAAELQRAQELQRLRWENEQARINQMAEGSERRIRQIKLDYDQEIAEIQAQEAKWRDAQNGELTAEQRSALTDAYALAQGSMEGRVREVEDDEVKKGKEKLNNLLEQYKDYDQKRRGIDTTYAADMEVLQEELNRLRESGSDTAEVESSIHARTEAYRREIQSLENEILQSTDFYDKLFADTSEKGYKVLRDFYAQAKEVLANAKVGGDGVEISVPYKDADGKFVQKSVKVTVAEFQKMKKQVDAIRKQLEKDNPFTSFRTAWKDLTKAMKEGGDVSGAVKNLNTKGKELTKTIKGWGDSLGAVFGDRFSQSMEEMLTFCDGVMDMGTGIAQIWSGDIVGGITNALSGLSSIVSMFTSWKEKMEEMKRQWYIAEIETNRSIRERAEIYAADQSKISNIIKDVETLNWLVAKGYAKPASVSVWEAQSAALEQYQKNLKAEAASYDNLWNRLQGSNGYYEWGNSLNGGSAEWSLRGYSAEQIELWYNQNKLSNAARDYYEAWVASGKSIEELKQHIEECYQSMQEMVMGVSFDSFLTNARDVLKQMRSDVGALGEFTEDTLSEALLNAFMYKDLAKVLEPLYDELSEHLIDGTADRNYLENWRRRFEDTMSAANDRLDAISEVTGIDLGDSSGTSQSAKVGGFAAMTQDQGTKLEGMFTSGLQHWSNMDEKMENVSEKMNAAENHLAKIEENTGKSAEHLEKIAENMVKIIRDGLKVK